MTIAALEDGDDRAFSIAVAGPAALVVAKTHKIAGRRDEAKGRLGDKDAFDAFRLLRAVDPPAFAAGFARLRAGQLAADSTLRALSELEALFCGSELVSVGMVVRATEGLMLEAEVRAAVPLLARGVLGAAGGDAAPDG